MKFLIAFLLFCFTLPITLISSTSYAQDTESCPNSPVPRLSVGTRGQVTPGDPNNIRAEPSSNSALLGVIPGEGVFDILDGHICADGFNWWQVQFEDLVGWTVEGSGDDYWLQPYLTLFEEDDVLYNNIQFEFDDSLASEILAEIVLATDDGLFGEPYPQYTQFSFADFPEFSEYPYANPRILIYPTFELERNPRYFDDIARIRQLLIDRPDNVAQITRPEGMRDAEIPMIVDSGLGAGQVIRTQVRFVDFANGSGIRFITLYAQDTLPITSDGIFYTFQGMTNDGQYYISMTFPIALDILGNEGVFPFPTDDRDAFNENYWAYLDDTELMIDSQADDAFSPSLSLLDDIIRSLQVGDSTENTNFVDVTSPTFTPTPSTTPTPTPSG